MCFFSIKTDNNEDSAEHRALEDLQRPYFGATFGLVTDAMLVHRAAAGPGPVYFMAQIHQLHRHPRWIALGDTWELALQSPASNVCIFHS